jgi:glycine betaine/proline transport system substrate-binding protein
MRILMRSRGKIIIALLLVLSLSLVLLGCNSNNAQQSSGDPKDTPIRIGVNNWPENIAAANMWKILLEEKGYKVELISGEKAPIYTGVSSGDLELGLEVWLPLLDKPYYDQYKDKLETYGPWYNGARVGLVVPEYVDVNSIEELNDNKDKFLVNGTPTIVGIDAGASIMKETAGAIEKYNLDYQLMNGSEAAMMAALKRAYDNNEPVAVTHWTPQLGPHSISAAYQHRLPVLVLIESKQAAETTDSGQNLRPESTAHRVFNQVDGLVAGINIHPRVGISQPLFLFGHVNLPYILTIDNST